MNTKLNKLLFGEASPKYQSTKCLCGEFLVHAGEIIVHATLAWMPRGRPANPRGVVDKNPQFCKIVEFCGDLWRFVDVCG